MRPLFVAAATGAVAFAATYLAWPAWRWWPVLAWMAGTALTVAVRAALGDDDPAEDIATPGDYVEEEWHEWHEEEWWYEEEWDEE